MKFSYLSYSVVFLLLSITCFGQEEEKTTRKLELKDGSVLVGEVIEDNDFHVKIVIETGDTLTVGYKNIGRQGKSRSQKKAERTYPDNNYFFNIGLYGQLGESSSSEVAAHVGKRMNSRLNLGLNFTYLERSDFITNLFVRQNLLNIGAYTRYYLTDKKPKIFVDGTLGYGFDLSQNNGDFFPISEGEQKGGIMGRATVGIHLASRKKLTWLINFGVEINKVSGDVSGFDPFGGQVRTVYNKEYTSPILGFMLEF